MAQGYDADVQLSVGLSLEDVRNQSQKLSSEVSKIFDLDSSKFTMSMNKAKAAMSKVESQVEETAIKIEDMENHMANYERYQELERELVRLGDAWNKLDAERSAATNIKEKFAIEAQMEAIQQEASALLPEMAEIKELGHDTWRDADTMRMDNYKNRMSELNNQQRLNIAAFREMQQAQEQEQQQAEQAEQQQQQEIANAERSNEQIAEMSNRYRELGQEIERIKQRRDELASRGTGAGYTEYDSLTRQLADAEREYDKLGKAIDEYNQKQAGASESTNKLTEAFENLGKKALSTISSKLKQFTSSLLGAKKATNSFGTSFKQIFRKILAYGLGIASITSLFNKIRSAIQQNLKYFAQFNEGNNQVNESISQLQSSLNALKGSLASAFLPIINVVSPILSNFIDQLASVINSIGMFIARLTGAKSYMMVSKKATNYAASGSGGGSGKSQEEKQKEVDDKRAKEAAKAEEKQAEAAEKLAKAQEKANKQLQSFDELNNIALDDTKELADYTEKTYDDPTGGGGGAGAPFNMEEVPLDGMEWDWDAIKAKAEELGRKFADFLNGIFANEDLAKDIGHNIAEALNTALHFVYGFVDQLDWKQMGHWLGTLIQTGIEDFEWDLLGETIGKLVNGVANAIIGFFERYDAGTLGESIATMFNNAVDEINTDDVGEAIGDVIAAPLVEITSFLKEADLEKATQKLFKVFERILTAPLLNSDKTLGYIIGEALATVINKGFEILMGADASGAIAAVTQFLRDIFIGAIENFDFITYIEAVATYCIEQAENIYNRIVLYIRGILEALSYVPGKVGEAANKGLEALDSVNAKFDDAKQSVHDLADAYREELPSSLAEVKQAVEESTDYIKIQSNEVVDDLKDTSELLAEKSENVGQRVGNVVDNVQGRLDDANTAMETSKQVAENYSTTTTEALDSVGEKSQDVKTDFSDMSETVQLSVDELTKIIDTWYEKIKKEYFNYDKWFELIDKSMVKALKECVDDMIDYWSTSYDDWWNNIVVPSFAQSKWETEFNHVYKAAESAFTKVANIIKSKMQEAVGSVQSAVSQMSASIATVSKALGSVKDVLNSINEMDVSGKISQLQVNVSGLATGAVIPPNREFLAVLGDQKHGTNVEAPLDTIKQAMAETLSAMNYSSKGNEDIVIQIDGYEVFRAVRNQSERFRNSTGYGVL